MNLKELVNEIMGDMIVYHGSDKNFHDPKFVNSGNEIGFHVGNLEQAIVIAQKREKFAKKEIPLYIHRYVLNVKKPLRVDDLVHWDVTTVSRYLKDKKNIDVNPGGKGYLGSKFIRPEDVIKAIEDAGYDSLVYDNEYEGYGDSYIVFHPHQIRYVDTMENKNK
jgi:hypothetical protein